MNSDVRKNLEEYILSAREKHYRIAWSHVRNREDALDIIQESIYRALSYRGDLNPQHMETWFCTVLINTARDHLRKNSRITVMEEQALTREIEKTAETPTQSSLEDREILGSALEKVDALITAYPNFRLAHLIRGDLLLARARPLATFGNQPDAPADKLADLREEAVARLKAYRNRPPTNYVPRYLLQMEPEQKYAIVVDTQKARLYIYQNDNGRPRFVADYYISHGKLGAEKSREGDKRTPVGVYHVTANLPRQKLSDFYGNGAFPINYPNEWDRQQGRDGGRHGACALNGTPRHQAGQRVGHR